MLSTPFPNNDHLAALGNYAPVHEEVPHELRVFLEAYTSEADREYIAQHQDYLAPEVTGSYPGEWDQVYGTGSEWA